MALGHTYGFTADTSDIRVKNLYAERVKVIASYGY